MATIASSSSSSPQNGTASKSSAIPTSAEALETLEETIKEKVFTALSADLRDTIQTLVSKQIAAESSGLQQKIDQLLSLLPIPAGETQQTAALPAALPAQIGRAHV
jgi:hypothetical protein